MITVFTLIAVAAVLAAVYGFFWLQNVLDPDLQEPSTMSQHRAIALVVRPRTASWFLAGMADPRRRGHRDRRLCRTAQDRVALMRASS
ncbi:MAG TPA: hypothetical protein VN133_13610 [Humibacter sp.]|nr:hypothetical protein [Humibacter sp.]